MVSHLVDLVKRDTYFLFDTNSIVDYCYINQTSLETFVAGGLR